MSKRTLIAIALVVMTVSVVGAASYTSATVNRDATIAVEEDETAVIGLESGGVSGISDTGDQLTIDLGQGNGLNTAASFTYGDSADPQNTYAFSVTNNDGTGHEFSFDYAITGTDPDSSNANVQFEVFDDNGASVGTASEAGALTGVSIAPGTAYTVVVTVDTENVDSSESLSGTLTISASTP